MAFRAFDRTSTLGDFVGRVAGGSAYVDGLARMAKPSIVMPTTAP
ncbi:MAG: hypothetical protein AVDCRST_MAG02-4023 [uncultured Rubrobacteraceae bacterium]|uniref:Uncharacterized protein n=1 Tax=uncultured Rubrobacteraceae bacterium TaxID=349277 RepID=A0A6J4RE31_9ACTN|nr:MAG: hypothetical protein AVDCRST_MAG02-4023 [uncultured Rubrobacteraceae bacterium]